MISVLVFPLVPKKSMLIVVRIETGENSEFPDAASFKPPFIIDMVKFHMDCEALNDGGGGVVVSKSPKAPLTDKVSSK